MAYKGTLVATAAERYTETGMQTELGRIAGLLQGQDEGRTPLQKRLTVFGQKLAWAVLAICLVVFIAGLLRGEQPLLMLLTAISLAVAAIPEALPAVITISLALGAKKLVKQQALIRKLPAVETLGSVTYICSDKTGTLTLNRMVVEEIYIDGQSHRTEELSHPGPQNGKGTSTPGQHPADMLFSAMTLCNDTRADASNTLIGDPTETALFELAREKNYLREHLDKQYPRVAEIPFDSDRKLMTTFHPQENGRVIAFTKGAVEEIMERCDNALGNSGQETINRVKILEAAEKIAGKGLRTLGFAMRVWDAVPDQPTGTSGKQYDFHRDGRHDGSATARSGGGGSNVPVGRHRPVMITGDHPLTASIIAERVGVIRRRRVVMTGRELAKLSCRNSKNGWRKYESMQGRS